MIIITYNLHQVLPVSFSFLPRSFDEYIDCKIVATPAKYDFKPYAWGFQKDSPFLPLFNYYLNAMKEKGSLQQIQVKYEPRPQSCPDYSGKSLGVGSVFSAFSVLFFGIGMSVILFGMEKFTQALGMKLSIFNTYGSLDQQNESYEKELTLLLSSKDKEIILLKEKILDLKKDILKNPTPWQSKSGWVHRFEVM